VAQFRVSGESGFRGDLG